MRLEAPIAFGAVYQVFRRKDKGGDGFNDVPHTSGPRPHGPAKVIEVRGLWAIYTTSERHSETIAMAEVLDPRQRSVNWLSGAGLRPTRQRVALAELLVGDGQDRHVTAESLFAASADSGAPVSLATVYNTLRAFCDAGLMREITVDGSKSYFDTNTSNHPHFYWEDSAEVTDAPAEELEIARLPQAPVGAEIAKVDVVIRLRRR